MGRRSRSCQSLIMPYSGDVPRPRENRLSRSTPPPPFRMPAPFPCKITPRSENVIKLIQGAIASGDYD
jgi:hypothetical protein